MTLDKLAEEYEVKNCELAQEALDAIKKANKGLEDLRFGEYVFYSLKVLYFGLKGNANDISYLLRKIQGKVSN